MFRRDGNLARHLRYTRHGLQTGGPRTSRMRSRRSLRMKIVDVLATNLTIPYPGPVRPAWQPGLVATSHNFTLVRVRTDDGLTGIGGTSGHLAGTIVTQVKPYLIGEDPLATERVARVYRSAG